VPNSYNSPRQMQGSPCNNIISQEVVGNSENWTAVLNWENDDQPSNWQVPNFRQTRIYGIYTYYKSSNHLMSWWTSRMSRYVKISNESEVAQLPGWSSKSEKCQRRGWARWGPVCIVLNHPMVSHGAKNKRILSNQVDQTRKNWVKTYPFFSEEVPFSFR
jgi:hypothetical protein